MKLIELTQGKVAQVSDRDYRFLRQWKWYAVYSHGLWYAARQEAGLPVYMHRSILPCAGEVDHRDGDGLNNQRRNLRQANRQTNTRNRKKSSNNTSGYKGVSWEARLDKWRAYIYHGRRKIHLGCFDSAIEAARAYDVAAKKYHGRFARTNF